MIRVVVASVFLSTSYQVHSWVTVLTQVTNRLQSINWNQCNCLDCSLLFDVLFENLGLQSNRLGHVGDQVEAVHPQFCLSFLEGMNLVA